MATTLGSLVLDLQANTTAFLRGMERAENSVQRLERNIRTTFRNINRTVAGVGFLAGGELIQGMGNLVTQFAASADQTGKFADRLGIAVEDLTRFQHAAELSGLSVEVLNASLLRQVNRVAEAAQGTGAARQALEDLGLSAERLASLTPDQQFDEIADAMRSVGSAGRQVQLAIDIWGREGSSMLQIVSAGAGALEDMRREADALGVTLTGDAARSAANFNDALFRLTQTMQGLTNTVLPALLDPLATLFDFISNAIAQFRALGDSIRQNFGEGLDAAGGALERIVRAFAPNAALLISALSSWSAAQSEVNEKVRETARGAPLVIDINQALAASNEEVKESIEDTIDPIEQYTERLKEQLEEIRRAPQYLQALRDWFLQLPPEQAVDAIQLLTAEYARFADEAQSATTQVGAQADEMAQLIENSLDRLDNTFVRFWEDFLRSGVTSLESFRDLALSIAAEVIHAFTTRRLVQAISGFLPGAGGGAGGQDMPAGGGAGADTDAFPTGQVIGQGIAGAIIGALSASSRDTDAVVGAISTGVGTVIGGVIGTFLGGNTILGGIIGGGLAAALVGGSDNPSVRESQIFVGSTPRGVPGQASVNTEGPFGRFLSFSFRRFGGEGQLSNEQVGALLDRLQAASEIAVEIDARVARTLDEMQIRDIARELAQMPEGFLNFDEDVIRDFFRGRFAQVFDAVNETLDGLFLELTSDMSLDEILQLASDIAYLNEQFSEGRQVFTDVAGIVETVNVLMEEFARTGESLGEVLERIARANLILQPLGLQGDTRAGAQFNVGVLQAAGGAGRLQELVSNYLNTFFTAQENLVRQYTDLNNEIPRILADLGTTRDSFVQDFQAAIEAGTLDEQAVVDWLNAGEAIGALLDVERQLADIRRQSTQETIGVINEEIRAVDAQIQAHEDLATQIDAVTASIRETFGRTIENIQLSLLDSQGQYEFFRQEAERLAASLTALADPEAIRQAMEQINQRVGQAFAVLSEEQQQIIGRDFIGFLEETLAVGEQRLQELSEENITQQRALEQERAALMDRLADRMEEAAASNQDAAATFAAASSQFARAAARPREIEVRLIANEDLVGA